MNSVRQPVPSGLFLVNKKSGITSFDSLFNIKRIIGSGKAGHTGTLDKFASGLLAVLTGQALKMSVWFSHCDKKYTGTICFGNETDTLDPEGNIIASAQVPSQKDIEDVLPQFTGTILQAPPEYSAIRINGKRASAMARSGTVPQMQKRQVYIYALELLSYQPPFANLFVHCSSGTYIRSLARDIALAAGSRAHLSALTRTQIAGFTLGSEDISPLMPINTSIFRLLGIPWFDISQDENQKIKNGKPIAPILNGKQINSIGLYEKPQQSGISETNKQESAGIFFEDTLAAMAVKKDGVWKYGFVYENN